MTEKEYRQARFERPRGATEILLVRHGESQRARPGHMFPMKDGHGDPELAEEGRLQAQLLGERLRHLPIDAVYVTKLRRTSETAAPLCRHLNISPIVEPNLHEVGLGEWEGGVFRIKVAENDPLVFKMLEKQRWDIVPGAEPENVFHERIQKGIARYSSPRSFIPSILGNTTLLINSPCNPSRDISQNERGFTSSNVIDTVN